MPRGGRRPGAGRKPKNPQLKVLGHPAFGTAVNAPVIPTTNYPPSAHVEEFDAPDSLTAEERKVWLEQAPHAFQARTLTRATAVAFERYCRAVVWERKEAESSARGGANHRGLLKQINAYELQFLLSPNGRPMAVPSDPAQTQPALGALSKFR